MTNKTRSWWAWGHEESFPTAAEETAFVDSIVRRFGAKGVVERPPVPLDEAKIPESRISVPAQLAEISSTDRRERARRARGRGYGDMIKGYYGDFETAPDLVLSPRTEDEVARILEWASGAGVAVVPYGGGSSVAGGVDGGGDWAACYSGVVSLDLQHLNQVLEVDRVSRAARIQAGVLGPHLEQQLREYGYTLRHFPQSFEFSTLGGWLATRAGGHYATVYTHIDDLTESMRVVTPTGIDESWRLPGSGAGPSPDRLLLGSEGILGVITEAWMRVQERPRYRAAAAVRFSSYEQGVDATRAVAQSALFPSNCRLLEVTEADQRQVETTGAALMLAFESADHPVNAQMERAVEICAEYAGATPEGVQYRETPDRSAAEPSGLVGTWRRQFILGPYLMGTRIRHGIFGESYETSCTWDRFPALHADVMSSAREVIQQVCAGRGDLTCRFTHVYPDGPAPYFTVRAVCGHGRELEMREAMERAIQGAFARNRATTTHHHAVGRQRKPWYDGQRPEFMARALGASKAELDPGWIMNPGVLVDPRDPVGSGPARPRA